MTQPGPEYHGADGDPRYPSPRKLRNVAANLADIVLPYGVVVVAFVAVVLLVGHDWMLDMDDQAPVMFGSMIFLVILLVTNATVLPSVFGSTVGQLLMGLRWIRGTDGVSPSARDMWRAFRQHRIVFRLGGVAQCAPLIVVVRRCDTTEDRSAVAVDTPGQAAVTYLEH
ncbi:RDD family protein [Nocardia sp. NPDC055049]